MDVDQLIDDTLENHYEQLSDHARNGFDEAGRGALLLEVELDEVEEPSREDAQVQLSGYFPLEELRELDLDERLYDLLERYDPTDRGVIIYGCEPLGYAAYFDFELIPDDIAPERA